MYFEELGTYLDDFMLTYIESMATFKVFLIRFGLHSSREYFGLIAEDRAVVITEFIKEKMEKNPKWLINFIESFQPY